MNKNRTPEDLNVLPKLMSTPVRPVIEGEESFCTSVRSVGSFQEGEHIVFLYVCIHSHCQCHLSNDEINYPAGNKR